MPWYGNENELKFCYPQIHGAKLKNILDIKYFEGPPATPENAGQVAAAEFLH